MKIQRVVFYVSRRTGAQQIAQECAQLLSRAGAALCAPQAYSRPVTLAPQVELVPDGQAAAGADLALVIGGDGTILRATYDAAPLGIPILGINMGRLGFLSELEPDEIHLLENVLSGDYSIEQRMMLAASVEREGQTLFQAHALNDVCASTVRRTGKSFLSTSFPTGSRSRVSVLTVSSFPRRPVPPPIPCPPAGRLSNRPCKT